MTLKGVHFLLTYKCDRECDHCFVYSSPYAEGTFSLTQIRKVFSEIVRIGTVEWIYFEGGEPFLFYPLMLEGVKIARDLGFKTGIVTDGYWATSDENAQLWLEPISRLGISDFTISDDPFHYDEEKDNFAKCALATAKRLNIPVGTICIERPSIKKGLERKQVKGKPVRGDIAMFRGRAVEKLTKGLPWKSVKGFTECRYEDLKNPERVHIDAYGNVHICQGLIMGNMWKLPLSDLVKNYNADLHPVCGPLVRGGPLALAKEYNVKCNKKYIDVCHFCYSVRKALLNRFPKYLAPRQVYGVK